jgi:hypothetical protein
MVKAGLEKERCSCAPGGALRDSFLVASVAVPRHMSITSQTEDTMGVSTMSSEFKRKS